MFWVFAGKLNCVKWSDTVRFTVRMKKQTSINRNVNLVAVCRLQFGCGSWLACVLCSAANHHHISTLLKYLHCKPKYNTHANCMTCPRNLFVPRTIHIHANLSHATTTCIQHISNQALTTACKHHGAAQLNNCACKIPSHKRQDALSLSVIKHYIAAFCMCTLQCYVWSDLPCKSQVK